MTFNSTETLCDQDAKYRYDPETLAYITISDIEHILERICIESDLRISNILRETAINKTSSVYQLFMKACDYLITSDGLNNSDADIRNFANKIQTINRNFNAVHPTEKKLSDGQELTAIGKVKKYRDDLFHDGITFLDRTCFFPFAVIKGKGYTALRVKKGGELVVKNIRTFRAEETEFAITSEGVFEILHPDTKDENWRHCPDVLMLQAANTEDVEMLIREALVKLREVWNELSIVRKEGINGIPVEYLNEGGEFTLQEKSNSQLTAYGYNGSTKLIVKGSLTITPPDELALEGSVIAYK